MPATRLKIFVSSVQKEFAEVRANLKAFLLGDAVLRRFISEVFLFEELPASDRRADEVYLDEVDRSDIYLGIFGKQYGFEDAEGLSPTEREYDRATRKQKTRLIYVWGTDDDGRAPKMRALIRKASDELIRRRIESDSALTAEVYASLVDHLDRRGALRIPPFDTAAAEGTTIYQGDLFALADQAREFVLSRINRTVGTRTDSGVAPAAYEQPEGAVAEAIINAIAHRDYNSNASVEVRLFSDRLEVWNPGALPGTLTAQSLREDHASVPNNPLIADPLYLARYIEKAGTGTQMMIALCRDAGLPEPDFEERHGSVVVTLWRDWLTDEALSRLEISDRQREAISFVRTRGGSRTATIGNRPGSSSEPHLVIWKTWSVRVSCGEWVQPDAARTTFSPANWTETGQTGHE